MSEIFKKYVDRVSADLKKGSFPNKSAQKDALDSLNRAYYDLRSEFSKTVQGTVDLPYGLYQVRDHHLENPDFSEITPRIRRAVELRDQVRSTPIVAVKSSAQKRREADEKEKATSPIYQAVLPLKEQARKMAEANAREYVKQVASHLAENGWDFDLTVPLAKFTDHGRAAEFMMLRRSEYMSLVRPVDGSSKIVEIDPEMVEIYVKKCIERAEAQYEAYATKLMHKIGKCKTATLEGNAVWDHSLLHITKRNGETEKWKTQIIDNVSVLGNPFNQWPTRKIK